ncbi:DUF2487 family protein [Alkalihalobacillus sp. NPDC078480]
MMKWTTKDIQVYQKEKAYVDTVLIPLMPLGFQKEQTKTVLASEYIESISLELERMYQGRLLTSLPFTYLSSEKVEDRVNRLESWIESWKKDGAKHILLLTSDSNWRDVDVLERIEWVPAIQLHGLSAKDRANLSADVARDLSSILTKKWS